MTHAKRSISLAAALIVLAAVFSPAPANAAAGLESRTSATSGVTVKVTPKNVASSAATWEFAIVLDSHTQDLSDDLLKSARLIDGENKQHAPIAWDGAPPGGHHREGVLRFKPIAPAPQAVELQITRPGESTPRSFRWQLK